MKLKHFIPLVGYFWMAAPQLHGIKNICICLENTLLYFVVGLITGLISIFMGIPTWVFVPLFILAWTIGLGWEYLIIVKRVSRFKSFGWDVFRRKSGFKEEFIVTAINMAIFWWLGYLAGNLVLQ